MENEEQISFPCIGCGLCCKKVKSVIDNVGRDYPETHPLYFPYNFDESGACEKLTADNKCSIYEDRPILCNVDKLLQALPMSRIDFFNMNIDACNSLMDEANLPIEMRINHIKVNLEDL